MSRKTARRASAGRAAGRSSGRSRSRRRRRCSVTQHRRRASVPSREPRARGTRRRSSGEGSSDRRPASAACASDRPSADQEPKKRSVGARARFIRDASRGLRTMPLQRVGDLARRGAASSSAVDVARPRQVASSNCAWMRPGCGRHDASTRSPRQTASRTLWVTKTIVLALLARSAAGRRRAARASSRRARRRARPSAARAGSGASARASATRCFMPPESSWMLRVREPLEADQPEVVRARPRGAPLA